MPCVFLSPSTQPANLYATEGNEQEYMNKIADLMVPMLFENDICVGRNSPDTNVGVSIKRSNAGDYDLHLALHSNAAPDRLSGQIRGVDAYYYDGSVKGERAADIYVKNLKEIYPLPDKVRTVPTTSLIELKKTDAPAVLLELGYHDNVEDEKWIKDNIENIAKNLTKATCEYFGLPYTP